MLIVGLVVGQLGSLAHFAIVRHVVCEHGAIAHEAERHDSGVAPADPSAWRRAVTGVDVGDSDADGDDHCDSNALRHRVELDVTPRVGEASLLSFADAPSAPPRPEHRPFTPLALAPKSSPPASAA